MVSLGLDSGAFKSGLDASEKQLRASTKRIEAVGKSMAGLGKSLSLGVTAPLAAIGVASVKAAIESQQAIGQVNAALKSMGDGAGRTAEQLQVLATGQMRQSLYDDDDILRKVTANLLTFGNVAGAQFDRAQQAAIDLSARMGTDLQASTIMLGKALNDPIKGMNALKRAGIQFTDQQKEQITAMVAAGNAVGAQKIMLAELERQFGGSAAAMRANDPFGAMTQSWNEFQEKVGAQLLKAMPAITAAVIGVLDAFNSLSPGMQQAVVIGGAMAAAFGPVLLVFGNLVVAIAPLIAALYSYVAVNGVAATAGYALGTAIRFMLGPIGLIITAVGLAYLAWKNWDKIKPIIQGALDWIMKLYQGVKKWIGEALVGYLNAVLHPINAVTNAFKYMWDKVIGHSYVPDMVDGIALHFARLNAVMVSPAETAAKRTKQVFEKLAGDVESLMRRLFPEQAIEAGFATDKANLNAGIAAGGAGGFSVAQLQAGKRALQMEEFKTAFKDFQVAVNDNATTTETANVRIQESFKDMADKTLSTFQNLASAIKGGGFLNILNAAVGLGMQFGKIGAFGKGIQTRLNAVPARAMGGPVMGGQAYMVGERGPELIVPGRGGTVIPNHALNGASRGNTYNIQGNLMTPEFWAQIHAGDVAAADAGGNIGVSRINYRQGRRVA